MLIKTSLLTLSILSILTGCAVGPEYKTEPSPIAKQFISQSVLENKSVGGKVDLRSWWTKFGDDLLTRYINVALKQNLDLAQATARLDQAKAVLGNANAALLPSADITGQAARTYQSIETPIGQVLNSTPNFDRYGNYYETNLNTSWELDLFGALRRGKEAAMAEYQATEAGVVATQLAVIAETATIYINIRTIQARLEIAHKQVETQQEMFDLTKLLYNKGLASEREENQVYATLTQYQAVIPTLEASLDSALYAFDVILGTPPGTHRNELLITAPIPDTPAIIELGSPNELLTRRPDLIMAEKRLVAATANIGVAMAEYYPKLSLNGLLGSATSISGGNLFTNDANQATAAVGLRWRLFDFARIEAEIEHAKGKKAEALATYKLAVLRATEDVESAFSNFLRLETKVSLLSQSLGALTNARNASFSAYQHGTSSMLEVLKVDESLLLTSDSQILAQAQSVKAAITTFKALGGDWQVPRVQ